MPPCVVVLHCCRDAFRCGGHRDSCKWSIGGSSSKELRQCCCQWEHVEHELVGCCQREGCFSLRASCRWWSDWPSRIGKQTLFEIGIGVFGLIGIRFYELEGNVICLFTCQPGDASRTLKEHDEHSCQPESWHTTPRVRLVILT